MKIVVLAYAADRGGALSILNDFYNYVWENARHHEWIFIVSKAELKPCEHIKLLRFPKIKDSWFERIKWEKSNLKKIIYEEKADIVFSLQNLTVPNLKLPQVLYVHQPIPFQKVKNFSFLRKEERLFAIYQYIIGNMIRSSIKIADAVIVQTRWVKDAIIERFHNHKDKIFVVPPSIDISIFTNNIVQEKTNSYKNTFFYPAGALLYKNIDCIIKAAYILLKKGINDFKIVLTIKGDENSYAGRIKKMAEGLGKKIIFAGRMSREDVFKMYNTSTLVFPSYIETFGLPLLEAKLSGSIILTSDCPFSREILEEYQNAYYFNPFNYEKLADLMSNVISGKIIKSDKNITLEIQNEDNWKKVLTIIEKYSKTKTGE